MLLLKDQKFPQAGASVDITADPAGKLSALQHQVGNAPGYKLLAESAVRALLSHAVCTAAQFFVHTAQVIKAVRTPLVKYAMELVQTLLVMISKHRAGKASMQSKLLETFQAERRSLRETLHPDPRADPPHIPVAGGVSTSHAFAPVSVDAHKVLTDMLAAAAIKNIIDKHSHHLPPDKWVNSIGCHIGYHIFESVWITLAHALDPLTEIVVLPAGEWPPPPDPGTAAADTIYYVAGWLALQVKLFCDELRSQKNPLTMRQKRLLEVMEPWTRHVQMTRAAAEAHPALSTNKASRKCEEIGALPAVFVNIEMNRLVWHLEHTVELAARSGALSMRGGVDLFARIECTLVRPALSPHVQAHIQRNVRSRHEWCCACEALPSRWYSSPHC